MRFTFGSNYAVAMLGELGDELRPRRVDPNKPDPRARAEMAAFDSLAEELAMLDEAESDRIRRELVQ